MVVQTHTQSCKHTYTHMQNNHRHELWRHVMLTQSQLYIIQSRNTIQSRYNYELTVIHTYSITKYPGNQGYTPIQSGYTYAITNKYPYNHDLLSCNHEGIRTVPIFHHATPMPSLICPHKINIQYRTTFTEVRLCIGKKDGEAEVLG